MSPPSEWALDASRRLVTACLRTSPGRLSVAEQFAHAFAEVFDTMRATSARQAAEAHAEGFRAGIEAAAAEVDSDHTHEDAESCHICAIVRDVRALTLETKP